MNIVDIAVGSEDFNILVTALTTANLADTIRNSDDITVFAPTDAAFTALAVDLGFDGDTSDESAVFAHIAQALTDLSDDNDPIPLLTDILLYHVSGGAKTEAEINAESSISTLLTDASFVPDASTLNDNELDLTDPMIVSPDIAADNGIIQGIDRVLLPIDIPGNTNIVDIAANSDDFNILVGALTAAGLVDTIRDAEDITVFAPTDAAFIALAEDLGYDGDTSDEDAVLALLAQTLETLDPNDDLVPLLAEVLLYHVSAGAKTQAEIEAANSITTLFDGNTITPDGQDLVDNEPDLTDPTIVAPDIVAGNGIIQGIDRVLLPVDVPGNTNIVDIAAGSDDFNLLVRALTTAGLADTVRASDDITVFAPTDAAFTALAVDLGFDGDTSDEDAVFGHIVQALTDLAADDDPIPLLTDILLYHVSGGAKTAAEINAETSVATLLDGATIAPDAGVLGDLEPDLTDPTIAVPDIEAANGIIQGIDRVLLPLDIPGNTPPTITGIVAASGGTFDDNAGDFDILLNAVITADLAGALDDPDADLTVFAPTDAAFIATAQALGCTGSDEAGAFAFIVDGLTLLSSGGDPVPLLSDILLYHVAPDARDAGDVLGATTIPTLLGADVGVDGAALVDNDPDLPNANIIDTDIPAQNGIVHVIDGVLIPVDLLPSDGSDSVDFLFGSDASETFALGLDDDFVDAKGGDDTITGGPGDDVILGGAGTDAAHFAGSLDDYTLQLSAEGLRVTDKGDAGTGSDFLTETELLTFADGASFLADGAVNIARLDGATTLSEADLTTLTEVYIAYFDRAPDAFGLLFWAEALANGSTLHEIAELFFEQAETHEILPDTLSSGEFVDKAYAHLWERAADTEGREFWVNALESGDVSRAKFMVELIEGARANTSATSADDVRTIEDKSDIGVSYALIEGLTNAENAATVMQAYERDDRDDSLMEAQMLIEGFADDAAGLGTDGETEVVLQLVGVIDDPFAIV